MSHSQNVSSEVNQSPRNVRTVGSSLDARLYLRDEGLDAGVGLLWAAQKRLAMAASASVAATGLSARACDILIAIRTEPGRTVSQMCEQLGMTVPTFARILGQLDKAGLVEKNRSVQDGRARLLHLSPAGHERVEPVMRAMRDRLRVAFRETGPEHVSGARAVLAALLGQGEG